MFFFFNDTATTEIYTLSLHDALPADPTGIGRPSAPGTPVGGACHHPRPAVTGTVSETGSGMTEPVGVPVGRVCPGCGREDSGPLRWGLPAVAAFRLARPGPGRLA